MEDYNFQQNGITEEDELFASFISLHRLQLSNSGVPEYFWKTLFEKLRKMEFDAGKYFSLLYVEYEEEEEESKEEDSIPQEEDYDPRWKVVVSAEEGVDHTDPKHIYLVDHAWTYKANQAQEILETMPELLHRMANLMDIVGPNDIAQPSSNVLLKRVLNRMWKYNQTYSFGGLNLEAESTVPVWYVMDEFGSRIQHSLEPTCRMVPFLYLPAGTTFSLLFPIVSLESGDELTRNYIEGPDNDELTQSVLLLPWQPKDLSEIVDPSQEEPDEAFMRSGRIEETVPDGSCEDPLELLQREVAFKVYSEYDVITQHLTHPAFTLCSTVEEADILWYLSHFKEFRQLNSVHPHKFINQFPFEHVLTVKDLLAVVCRRSVPEGQPTVNLETLDTRPPWLPTTYNLATELPKFVSYFQLRAKRGLDNLWIVKPWNLARSLDTTITNNLDEIIRLRATGPKVVCKYLWDPVLYSRPDVGGAVKFDIRYVVLVRSLEPIKAYVYSKFWLRFANRPFNLENLHDYQQHFTVMNYNDAPLQQMFCEDFIENFESQYPNYFWKDIQDEIITMLRQVLGASIKKKPPAGPLPNPQSRAIYAADIMLQWDHSDPDNPKMQPMLLEVNWAPDCQRACQYYPHFFNDVFSTLFLDKPVNTITF